jgi:hypothetical protein
MGNYSTVWETIDNWHQQTKRATEIVPVKTAVYVKKKTEAASCFLAHVSKQ